MTVRGRGFAAPPTATAPARRLVATVTMAAALGVLGWAGSRPPGEPPAPGRLPPFAPGPMPAETGAGAPSLLVLDGPSVVLYVDDACPFCAEEIRRWHAAVGDIPPDGLRVIRHPAPGVIHPGIAPSPWASLVLVDRSGAVAESLGVTAVPFLALTDTAGSVVEVALGLTPEHRILALLATLGRDPGKEHGYD